MKKKVDIVYHTVDQTPKERQERLDNAYGILFEAVAKKMASKKKNIINEKIN